MVEQIKRYFELKTKMAEMDRELKGIRDGLRENLGGAKVEIEVDGDKVRAQTKKRKNKRCAWETFKSLNEELYNEVVVETESEYYELRKIVNR